MATIRQRFPGDAAMELADVRLLRVVEAALPADYAPVSQLGVETALEAMAEAIAVDLNCFIGWCTGEQRPPSPPSPRISATICATSKYRTRNRRPWRAAWPASRARIGWSAWDESRNRVAGRLRRQIAAWDEKVKAQEAGHCPHCEQVMPPKTPAESREAVDAPRALGE